MTERAGRRDARQQPHRPREILDAALELFSRQGYNGTSLRQIADAMELSVAALYYHFNAKSDLLAALAEPYLDELDDLVARTEKGGPVDQSGARELLDSYLKLLLSNTSLTQFLEQDLAVQAHPQGRRLDELTEKLRAALAGPAPLSADLVRASAALGALRRPVLRLRHLDLEELRDQLLAQALMVLNPADGGQA